MAKTYQQKMQNIKQAIDKRIEKANIEKGLVVLITGDGKGKSTSAFGTAARATGHGLNVKVCQFIKGTWACGERDLLEAAGVEFSVMATGFTWDTQNKETDKQACQKVWQFALKNLQNSNVDMVVLDELTYMLNFDYIDHNEAYQAIKNRPENQHIVITGRGANEALIELADTVSEIKSIKHAFDNGVKAQVGLDY
ncbi:cob(I)yrinic acid a,c-diamide adenosyltransferase [Marinicellulosiphila megalodicopiae]|uniref:cob(I)yrinic acid a,c-diamide adenosyltransferase n=1 Tax=Marinicellulosiphila megalodicopiae TaxID=2724896 RepID=UPI003BAF7B82